MFPDADPGERFWNRSGVWNKMNRGKRSLAMEAKTPEGKAILEQKVAATAERMKNKPAKKAKRK